MNPKIETKEAMHFVGITGTFISVHSPDADNFVVIPALWGRFHEVCEHVSDPAEECCYGVIIAEEGRARADELRYIAAYRVSSAWPTAGPLLGHSVPAATYAIVEHRGPVVGIGETLKEAGRWLESSDFARSAGAEIEAYPEEYDPAGADSVMETWIPVVPR